MAGMKRKAKDDIDIMEQSKLDDLLPSEVNIVDFAKCRARELEAMSKIASAITNNRSANQAVPIHMRRRAASHNVKRLPRRLQEAAKKEIDKGNVPVKTKCPSRYHRRRPGNQQKEYIRRQRKIQWLETHIWHAKRFHMTNSWGYSLALHPNDKSIRFAYRAACNTHHEHLCLMQDISYFSCVEIEGPEEEIISRLNTLTVKGTGATFGGAAYIHGQREGSTILYTHQLGQRIPIGPVQFMWRPVSTATEFGSSDRVSISSSRHLWLWVHPGCLDAVLRELTSTFQMTTSVQSSSLADHMVKNQESQNLQNGSTTFSKQRHQTFQNIDRDSLAKKRKTDITDHSPSERTNSFKDHVLSNGSVTVKRLTDAMCRFRLTGPKSLAVMREVLQPAEVVSEMVTADCNDLKWWQPYYKEAELADKYQKQKEFWMKLGGVGSSGELPPRGILGLIVRDPRLFLPTKKTVAKVVSTASGSEISTWPAGISDSPLWQETVRAAVKSSKMSDQEMNKRRANLLIPGTILDLGIEESRVPVLLIQRPGRRPSPEELRAASTTKQAMTSGFGSGWDIILPGGWAMAFWVALVYQGARVGGLRESLNLSTEEGVPHFPDDYPDTPAGQQVELASWQRLCKKYGDIPQSKKPNYIKLGIVAPFHHPWKDLLVDWSKFASQPDQDKMAKHHSSLSVNTVCTAQSRDIPNRTGCQSDGPVYQDRNNLMEVEVIDGNLDTNSRKEMETSNLSGSEKITFHVLRFSNQVRQLAAQCMPRSKRNKPCIKTVSVKKQREKPHAKVAEYSNVPRSVGETGSLLVLVRLDVLLRGRPAPFSPVAIPTPSDLEQLKLDKSYGGPSEPLHQDTTKTQRKAIAKLKKKKTKKKANKTEGNLTVTSPNLATPNVSDVKDSCTRPVIGYLRRGGVCLSSGKAYGTGFVSYTGLQQLLTAKPDDQHAVVLVRNPNSLQWRFSYLTVLTKLT